MLWQQKEDDVQLYLSDYFHSIRCTHSIWNVCTFDYNVALYYTKPHQNSWWWISDVTWEDIIISEKHFSEVPFINLIHAQNFMEITSL